MVDIIKATNGVTLAANAKVLADLSKEAKGEATVKPVKPAVDLSKVDLAPQANLPYRPKGNSPFSESMLIEVLEAKNPKRGKSAERFACYARAAAKHGNKVTIGQFLDEVMLLGQPGRKRHMSYSDITWDIDHEFIRLVKA